MSRIDVDEEEEDEEEAEVSVSGSWMAFKTTSSTLRRNPLCEDNTEEETEEEEDKDEEEEAARMTLRFTLVLLGCATRVATFVVVVIVVVVVVFILVDDAFFVTRTFASFAWKITKMKNEDKLPPLKKNVFLAALSSSVSLFSRRD